MSLQTVHQPSMPGFPAAAGRETAPPPNPGVLGELQRQAKRQLQQGEYAAALAAYAGVARAKPSGFVVGSIHQAANEWEVNRRLIRKVEADLGLEAGAVRSLARQGGIDHQAWLRWADDALPAWVGAEDEPVDQLIVLALRRLAGNAHSHAVIEALPSSPTAQARGWLIKAAAAQASGETEVAERLLLRAAALAPHVTQIHRGLGQFARMQGLYQKAASHFEAAVMSPNSSLMVADLAEWQPCKMGPVGDRFEAFCYRGRVFVLDRDKTVVGLKMIKGRLFAIRDTTVFRRWQAVHERVLRLFFPGHGSEGEGGDASLMKRALLGLWHSLPGVVRRAGRSCAQLGQLFVLQVLIKADEISVERVPPHPDELFTVLISKRQQETDKERAAEPQPA